MRIEKPSAVPVLSWLFRLHIAQAPPTTCSAGGLSCVAAEKRVPSSTQHEADLHVCQPFNAERLYIYICICLYVCVHSSLLHVYSKYRKIEETMILGSSRYGE